MRRWLLVLVLSSGCTFDDSVSTDPRIDCRGDTECPTGFFCQASVGRCVRLLSAGLAPPTLRGEPVVSPSLAARGQPLRVLFRVNEPLERAPVVRAVFSSGATAEATLLDLGQSPQSFTAELLPGADASEGAVRFFVDLLDVDGAEAKNLELGAAVLDFTPPAVVRGSAVLTLTPSATNQLSRVQAMNDSTLAQLTFAVTEPLAAVPALSLSLSVDGGLPAFSVTYSGSTGTSHLFSLALTSAATPQGPVGVQVALRDLAGNQSDVPIELRAPGLVIDTEAPPFVGLVDGGVVLRRAPTGAAFRFGTRGTTVTGLPGATEPGATVIASPTPTSPELARATASSTGAFELTLPTDLGSVTVRALDSAGNQSAPALVRQVSWFASLSGGSAGPTNPNPHRALTVRMLGPTPEPSGTTEHFGSSGLDAPGGLSVSTQGAANWRRVGSAYVYAVVEPPDTQRRLTLTWDPFRARVVGVNTNNPAGVVEWNGSGWLQVDALDPEADGNPGTNQSNGGLALDEDSRLLMLISSGSQWNERRTWGWTGTSWVLLAREGPPCTNCTLGWDSKRRRVLSFDAQSGTTAAWNSTARSWTPLVTSTAPSLLAAWPSLAFERHTGRWLRFGGYPAHDETWAFDGATWTLVATGGPPAQWGAPMAYDPVSRRVVLFGRERWAWNGQRWDLLSTAPLPTGTGAAVIAPALEQSLVVAQSDTFRLEPDAGGVKVAQNTPLLPFLGQSGSYSAVHDALIFTGSYVQPLATCQSIVRGLGPSGFFDRGGLPECRERGALAVDQRSGRFFYVGGFRPDGGRSNSVFMTDDAGLWRTLDASVPLPDGGLFPPPRSEPLAWVEPERGSLVMVGGIDSASAGTAAGFTLSGGQWVSGGPTPPPNTASCLWGGQPMFGPDGGLLLDPGFGLPFNASSCSLTGGGWSVGTIFMTWAVADGGLVTTSMPGPGLSKAPRSWDEGVGAWLSFGGLNAVQWTPSYDVGTDQLRMWSPNAWTVVPVVDSDRDGSPSRRHRHAMGYIRGRQATVLVGGESQRLPLTDAWELQLAGSRPALLFRVNVRDALAQGSTPVALVLEAIGGADDGDGGRPGVQAQVWHRQRWLPLGVSDGGLGTATTSEVQFGTVELRDPVVLQELLEEPVVTFALVPREGYLRAPPSLLVDFVEVRLDSAFPENGP